MESQVLSDTTERHTYSYTYLQLSTIYNDLLRSATQATNTLFLSASASVTAKASNLPITSITIGEGPTTGGKGRVNGHLPELQDRHALETPFFL